MSAKEVKEANGDEDEDVAMKSAAELSDPEQIEGWCFEYKIEDFSSIKHIASAFQHLFVPMLEHYSFYEEHLETKVNITTLNTADDCISDTFAFKGGVQKNYRPSRFNLPVRGGRLSIIC